MGHQLGLLVHRQAGQQIHQLCLRQWCLQTHRQISQHLHLLSTSADQLPSPTPPPTLTPIGTSYPPELAGFSLSNPFGIRSFFNVNRFLSPHGGWRSGGTGHYGLDLVTKEYAEASHATGREYTEENGVTYFEPSRIGTDVVAPTTGTIDTVEGNKILIESDRIAGLVIELEHVKTGEIIEGTPVTTNQSIRTTYYDGTRLGDDFPHLHLAVTLNGQDFDPWLFLPTMEIVRVTSTIKAQKVRVLIIIAAITIGKICLKSPVLKRCSPEWSKVENEQQEKCL